MATIHSTSLWFTAGSSDKEYHASIERMPDGWYSVPFHYGRRGSANSGGEKCTGQAFDKARRTYVSLIKSKMQKGYVPNISGQPKSTDMPVEVWESTIPTSPVQNAQPVMWNPIQGSTGAVAVGMDDDQDDLDKLVKPRPVPQLLNMIEEDEMKALIENDDFGAQQKYDGKRMTFEWSIWNKGEHLVAFNKKGVTCNAPHRIKEQLKEPVSDFASLCSDDNISKIILDGESVGNEYYVFDILGFTRDGKDIDMRGQNYASRYTTLRNLFNEHHTDYLKLAPLAETSTQKKQLLARLRKEGAEGIVFKKLDAVYTSGRPNSGGDQLKFKFYATASVIINKVNDKNSINKMLLDENGEEVIVGNCTVPASVKPTLDMGTVVEVRYLYAYKGGSLYQPTYIGIRDDVDNMECKMSQLKYKGEGEEDAEEVASAPLKRKILWQ
jgi:bifunctional non-homologous end joining protein LigD